MDPASHHTAADQDQLGTPSTCAPAFEPEIDLTLDEARETLYVLLRACERFTTNLKSVVEDLDKKQATDEWLLQVQEEAQKATLFLEQQHSMTNQFSSKVDAYIAEVRKEADEMALEELAARTPRKASKFVHPELRKFQLEKQARILGKYGGTPALGGLLAARPPKDAILKATSTPAAREIQYSKMENRDAQNLARVMQFKVQEKEAELSPWQQEAKDRTGKLHFDGTDDKDLATPDTKSHTPYASELHSKLMKRQEDMSAAEAAAKTPSRHDTAGPSTSGAMDELAEKLKRRQSAVEVPDKPAEQEEEGTPPTQTWSNSSAPFGSELSAVLRQRAASMAATTSSPPQQESSPSPPAPVLRPRGVSMAVTSPTPAAQAIAPELAALLKRRAAATDGEPGSS